MRKSGWTEFGQHNSGFILFLLFKFRLFPL